MNDYNDLIKKMRNKLIDTLRKEMPEDLIKTPKSVIIMYNISLNLFKSIAIVAGISCDQAVAHVKEVWMKKAPILN